jgi:glycosyltransferase involved in cell wall biosynthesis
MKNNIPLLSIACITYNQEKYIGQCIDGFLMQKTSFPIEIIIHDDASMDNTAKILKEYADKYPDLITPIFQTENQYSKGINPGFEFVFPECRGKYIAICEGDDYWTDPYKLQKQVDFLEANSDYVLSHTGGYRRIEKRIEPWEVWPIDGDVQEFFYSGCLVRTCSALFVKSHLSEYFIINQFCKSKIIGEWPLFAFYSTKGKFHYLSENMVVHRYNPTSVTSRKNLISYYNYAFDIIEVKRFLRDYIFIDKLNDLYNENTLQITENYISLRKAFDLFDYNEAKHLSNFKHKNIKAIKLSNYTKNKFLFFTGCLLKKYREIFVELISKRK